MTAVRAHRTLEAMGAVRKVRGGGTFANAVADFAAAAQTASESKLRRVVLFKLGEYRAKTVHRRTVASLCRRCRELGLEIHYERIARQSVSIEAVNGIRPTPYRVRGGFGFAPGAFRGRGASCSPVCARPDRFDPHGQPRGPAGHLAASACSEHLLERGYRRLHYVAGSRLPGWSTFGAAPRLRAVLRSVAPGRGARQPEFCRPGGTGAFQRRQRVSLCAEDPAPAFRKTAELAARSAGITGFDGIGSGSRGWRT